MPRGKFHYCRFDKYERALLALVIRLTSLVSQRVYALFMRFAAVYNGG